MSDDLIKRLRVWDGSPFDDDAGEAADRIEELELEKNEAWLNELDALSKLAKAVESIKQSIKLWEKYDGYDRERRLDNAYDGFEFLCLALAELEEMK